MSLRSQLLAVSLLLLSLPWAGCQYLREVESTLRQGQGMAADATARAIASALRERPRLLYPVPARRAQSDVTQDWYIPSVPDKLISDGYDDDWLEQPQLRPLADTPDGIAVYTASHRDTLFVLLKIDDETLLYRTPSQAGDRVLLHCIDALGANSRYQLSAEAPGLVRAQALSGKADTFTQSIRAAWRERTGGYSVEFQLPLDTRCQRFSLTVIDARGNDVSPFEVTRYDSRTHFSGVSPWLVYRVAQLDDWLSAFEEPGRRITVLDARNWIVGVSEYAAASAPLSASVDEGTQEPVFWLLRVIYRAVLNDGDSRKSNRDGVDSLQIEALADIGGPNTALGLVKVTETTERYLALTDKATSRVFGVSALVVLLAFAGLLFYATLLSWRIRQLRDAALGVAAQTSTAAEFPRSKAADELGELSRSYADLLRQINEYNAYLRGLARTLSHELRTPIAVVSSSLDNLNHKEASPDDRQGYVLRAQDGLSRLTRIVTAMTEASRIEESLEGTHNDRLDLGAMLQALTDAYRNTFPEHRFELTLPEGSVVARGNGELIAQALDKLVENAVSFAPPDSLIALQLRTENDDCVIDTRNQGPALPDALRERLFEPMVSLRSAASGDRKQEGTHLGMGLHIARAIAQAHGGSLQAADLPTADGVVFSLRLPRG